MTSCPKATHSLQTSLMVETHLLKNMGCRVLGSGARIRCKTSWGALRIVLALMWAFALTIALLSDSTATAVSDAACCEVKILEVDSGSASTIVLWC